MGALRVDQAQALLPVSVCILGLEPKPAVRLGGRCELLRQTGGLQPWWFESSGMPNSGSGGDPGRQHVRQAMVEVTDIRLEGLALHGSGRRPVRESFRIFALRLATRRPAWSLSVKPLGDNGTASCGC